MSNGGDAALPWYRAITASQWKTLWAAKLGWMLDAMDFLIYAMALTKLKVYFDFKDDVAGLLGTITLLVSAAGGLLFGVVADRVGRTRALMATIVIFSLCSLGTATAQSLWQLALWRSLLGIGMGGEWASGSTLISETWPAEHRGKAISIMQSGWALGYILAAAVSALFLDLLPLGDEGWRWLFAFGALPALFVVWIRQEVEEPAVWKEQQASQEARPNPFGVLFSQQYRARTILATLLTSAVQFAYWGLFFWLPGFLATPVERGGAGLSIVRSMGWIIPMQVGAYLGYLSFGFLAEAFGRRTTFIAFLLSAAVIVPIYGQMAREPWVLIALGPILGFVGHGYFSLFGALLAELYPTEVRATGQGLTYNCGRAMGALGPYTIGALAEHVGIGSALGLTSAFFVLGSLLIFLLPDTSTQELTKSESPPPTIAQ
ncbi:MAG: MFS transporter [Planctomycetes bacterium]|nr:MFS transporter [Planctomycetota bacterium]